MSCLTISSAMTNILIVKLVKFPVFHFTLRGNIDFGLHCQIKNMLADRRDHIIVAESR